MLAWRNFALRATLNPTETMAEIRNIDSAARRRRPGTSRPRGRYVPPNQRILPAPRAASLWERLQAFGADVGTAAAEHLAPAALRDLSREIEEKIENAPLATNDFGFDPWGFEKETAHRCFFTSALLYSRS